MFVSVLLAEYVGMSTAIQVPHARARRRADVGASHFQDVFFSRGERDVPGLERRIRFFSLASYTCVCQLTSKKCQRKAQNKKPAREETRWVDLTRGGTLRCQ